jgi:hypothetical protein
MFHLIYVMFLFVGHNDLSPVIGAASWGVARPGAALDSVTVDGWRGGGSRGANHPRGARGP